MAKHHPDLVFCRKQAGISLGRLCEKCDGKCVICDSYVRPHVLVHICDECNYGSYEGRCIICGAPGISDAYYCRECTLQEKDVRKIPADYHGSNGFITLQSGTDLAPPIHPFFRCIQRDGCPKIINLGSSRTDLFYGMSDVFACFFSPWISELPGLVKLTSSIHRCFVLGCAERKKYGFKKR